MQKLIKILAVVTVLVGSIPAMAEGFARPGHPGLVNEVNVPVNATFYPGQFVDVYQLSGIDRRFPRRRIDSILVQGDGGAMQLVVNNREVGSLTYLYGGSTYFPVGGPVNQIYVIGFAVFEQPVSVNSLRIIFSPIL